MVAATEDTTRASSRDALALAIEKKLTKDQILERYLNIAPFGNGAYGIFAASQVYFGKQPEDLTLEEAALLAGLVKAPSGVRPDHAERLPAGAWSAATTSSTRWSRSAYITQEQADAAKADRARSRQASAPPNGCVADHRRTTGASSATIFYRWWMDQEAFGATDVRPGAPAQARRLPIVTSLDVQGAGRGARRERREAAARPASTNALMLAAIEPGTGQVRALAVNRNFKLDDQDKPQNRLTTNPAKARAGIRGTYPNTTNPLLSGGGDITGYQAGSTFKIFTMVAALEKGYPLDYTINAMSPYQSKYPSTGGSPAACPGTDYYCPQNASASMAGAAQHVDRRSAARSTRTSCRCRSGSARPEGRRRGQAAGHPVPRRRERRATTRQRPGRANQLGRLHARRLRHHAAGAGQRVRHPRRRRHVLRADPGAGDPSTTDGKKLDVANPRCKQVRRPGRGPRRGRRRPLPGRRPARAYGKCAAARTAPATSAASSASRSPARPAPPTTRSRPTLVTTTKQLAVAGILADPDWPQTTHNMEHDDRSTRRSTRRCATR